ncbi:MAG: hypothetical protein AB7F65_02690 [Dehalococcoidia bacterium]
MPGTLEKLGLHWRPTTVAFAYAQEEPVAPRDGGWVELWDVDRGRRLGRGHLMLWPSEPTPATNGGTVEAEVAKDAVQPVGEDGPNLRAEIRGFAFEGDPPAVGDALSVRPEQEQDYYAVTVTSVESGEERGGLVSLDWPDDRLPASLSELGGY